jgi:hypothetical protein
MADSITVERDDEHYWELASAFAEVQIMELNDALKECGIEDADLRQKICSRFAFGMGNFLDQYWMEVDGKKHYPMVCFSQTFLDTDTPIESIAPLHIRSEDYEFHAGADDEAIFFFRDNGQQLNRCRIGCVADEGE